MSAFYLPVLGSGAAAFKTNCSFCNLISLNSLEAHQPASMPLGQSSSATDLENLQQRVFCFRNCSFSVPTKNGEKKILIGVSGEARSGEVLAILGPSGAGKTQLMNMLTLKPGPGTVSGELTLNGAPFTQKCVRRPFTPAPSMHTRHRRSSG